MTVKILLYGHSFVSNLRTFIRHESELSFSFNLDPARFLIQFSAFPGARTSTLKSDKCLESVQDFEPDIVILFVGTCDIYNATESPNSVAEQICSLAETLNSRMNVKQVIVMQTVHRILAQIATRYPVNCAWFNTRVDALNLKLRRQLPSHYAKLWKLKGFWSTASQGTAFSLDGTHLSRLGNKKMFNNVRAAIVFSAREL